MNSTRFLTRAMLFALGLNAVSALAMAQTQDGGAAPQLPPGWTAEDMQAMMVAATPGEMHAHLMKEVGAWECQTKMWMAADTEPVESTGEMTVKPMLDGRFTQVEMKGEMPGMGPYTGMGTYGFDNVSKKFVATWLDNFGTGMMVGEGELSADGKKLSWEFKGNCPIQKKQIVMREVETITSPTTKTLEMFGPDPKTGKEYKTMEIHLTKK